MDQIVDLAVLPQPSQSEASSRRWSDLVGMVASIACAIHCAAMPFVVASLPALGFSFLADEAFHKWMAVICFGIAMAAFIPGWRKHRRLLPGGIAVVGLTLICSAAFGLAGDVAARAPNLKKSPLAQEPLLLPKRFAPRHAVNTVHRSRRPKPGLPKLSLPRSRNKWQVCCPLSG